MLIPARHWSKSKFTGGSKCDTLVNNMLETFHSTTIFVRSKPVVTMLEDIRVCLMERWESNINNLIDMRMVCFPTSRKELLENLHTLIIGWLGLYFVVNVIVNLFIYGIVNLISC